MSVTDEIKARLDLVTYIGQHVQLKKAGRNYKACCPFHSEKTPSFFVDPDRQTWRCFGACAEGGDIFTFAQKMNGWDFKEALRELGKQAGVEVRKQTPEERQQTDRLDALRGLTQSAADLFHQALIHPQSAAAEDALRYAIDTRGFTEETIEKFQIGFAAPSWQTTLDALTQIGYEQDDLITVGLTIRNDKGRVYDRFRHRLMIPIRDDRGRVIGFGARALNPEDEPKYLNSPQTPIFDKSRVLFGLDTAKRAIRDSETAVIVEGYMDAIQAQQAGFYNVVAQMGTAMTEPQLKLIAPRYAARVILALDADAAGQSATRRSLETARQTLEADYAGRLSVDIRVLQIPGAKDPDDLIREKPDEWQALIENALPVADYVIEMETAALSPKASLQEREAIARRVLPILTASESNLYTQDNVQKLAMRLHISETDLLTWASEQRQQARKSPPRQPAPRASTPAAPPTIDDSDMPPVWDDDDGTVIYGLPDEADDLEPISLPRPAPAPTMQSDTTAYIERDCLRFLFRNAELYYRVNRTLRELARNDPDLLADPLSDFGVGDFTRSDYQALMQMFLFAVKQDGLDVLEFLAQNLDPVMLAEMDKLLLDDAQGLSRRINGRFEADRLQLWKHHESRVLPALRTDDEVVRLALTMRRRRLKTLYDDFRFMQMDIQKHDFEEALRIAEKLRPIQQATERIDTALAMAQP